MTSHMAHHLPEPDNETFERLLADLSRRGLKLTATRRMVLATAHRFGWFTGPDGIAAILADALPSSMLPPEITAGRGVEEMRRPRPHRATFRAAENHPPAPRWQVNKDGKTFYHPACDRDLPGGIDPADTADKAAHHHHTCPEVRDEY